MYQSINVSLMYIKLDIVTSNLAYPNNFNVFFKHTSTYNFEWLFHCLFRKCP